MIVRDTGGESTALSRAHMPRTQPSQQDGVGVEVSVGCVSVSSLFIRSPTGLPLSGSSAVRVGVAHCLRIASAPPGRLELEPVAMVTTRPQTSEKDELVTGCGFPA